MSESSTVRRKSTGETRYADCHTDRKHFALGLCERCYTRQKLRRLYWQDPEKFRAKNRKNYASHRKDRIATARRNNLRRWYGIDQETVDKMLLRQAGLCAICESLMSPHHIDHDHATGRVRALLCGNCNSGIGLLQDSPEIIRAAAEYIESHR
jgi:hypothetical protein